MNFTSPSTASNSPLPERPGRKNLPSRLRALDSAGRLTAAAIMFCLASIWIVFAIIVKASYDEHRQDASNYAGNVAALIAADLGSIFETYDLSLRALVTNLADPEVTKLPGSMRAKMLFDSSTNASTFGAMVVIDKNGIVIDDSRRSFPHHVDVSDREYFKAQRSTPAAGLFISHPYKSRVTGEYMVGASRRLDAGGRFDGVALGTLKLAALRSLFAKARLPPGSIIALRYLDGSEMAGWKVPEPGAERPEVSSAQTGGLEDERYMAGVIDAASTLTVSRRIVGLPLEQTVSIPMSAILATFWQRTLATAAGFLLLSATIVALGMTLTRELTRRAAAEASLRRLATTDGLTGLVNRGRFDELLRGEVERSLRTRQPLALLMIDVDHFKAYNDTYGHSGGDATLRAVAEVLSAAPVRQSDVVARIGGEEFAILMPDTDAAGADHLAERIQEVVRDKALPHAGSPTGILTISIGIACHGELAAVLTPSGLFDDADGALYRAKHGGRNTTRGPMSHDVPRGATLAA